MVFGYVQIILSIRYSNPAPFLAYTFEGAAKLSTMIFVEQIALAPCHNAVVAHRHHLELVCMHQYHTESRFIIQNLYQRKKSNALT